MRKYALIVLPCTLALTLAFILYIFFNSRDTFSCKSQYDLTENINENILRSQGLLSAELSNHRLLINLEGLLTSNGDKYIVSRTIALNLKKTTTPVIFFIFPMRKSLATAVIIRLKISRRKTSLAIKLLIESSI